jgi:hypothetical protein
MDGIGETLGLCQAQDGTSVGDYKTHCAAFADSARDIGAAMRDEHTIFAHVFVGFSMGAGGATDGGGRVSMPGVDFNCHTAPGNSAVGAAAQPRYVGAVALEYSLARTQREPGR